MHYLRQELEDIVLTENQSIRQLLDSALDGIWYLNVENGKDEWFNDDFWHTLGYDPAEKPSTVDAWKGMVHPEDEALSAELLAQHFKNPDVPYVQILRYTHKQGHTVYIRCSGQAIVDDGKPIRMLGVHVDVTEEHNRINQLVETINYFKGLILVADADGVLQYWNDHWHNALDMELSKMGNLGFSGIVSRLGETLASELHQLSLNGTSSEVEIAVSSKKGIRYFNCRLLRDTTTFYLVGNDITDITEKTKTLEDVVALQELMVQLSHKVIRSDRNNRSAIIDRGLMLIGEHVGADRAYVFEYDWDDYTASNSYEWCREGIPPQIGELQGVPLSHFEMWVEAHRDDQLVYIPEVSLIPNEEERQILSEQGIKSLLAIPLMGTSGCEGMVGFDWVQNRGDYHLEYERILRVFASLVVDIEHNVKQQRTIALGEELNLSLLESIPQAVLIRDLDHSKVLVNQEFSALTGYSIKDLDTFIPPFAYWPQEGDELDRLLDGYEQCMTGKRCVIETHIKNKRKEEIPVRIDSRPILDHEGRPARLITHIADMREMEATKRELQSELRLRTHIVQDSPISMVGIARSGKIHFCNPSFEKLVSIPIVIGQTEIWNCMEYCVNRELVGEQIRETLSQGKANFQSVVQLDFPGEEEHRYYQLRVRRVHESDQEQVEYVFYISDISELTHSNQKLHEVNYWLRKSQDQARLAHFRYSHQTGKLYVSEQFKSWYPEVRIFSNEEIVQLEWLYPTDQRVLKSYLRDLNESNQPFTLTLPLNFTRVDQQQYWVEINAENLNDSTLTSHGEVVGTIQDVTEMMTHLENVEQSRRRLTEIAWDQSHLVRAPLARIMALAEGWDEEDYNEKETIDLLQNIRNSAVELDQIIRQVVKKTETVIKSESIIENQSTMFDLYLIDDDPIFRTLQARQLEKLEVAENVEQFADGQFFVDAIGEMDRKNRKKLILLDLNMPRMDGWEVLDYLEQHENNAMYAVAIVSSSTDQKDYDEAMKYHLVLDYLEKPIGKERLRQFFESERLQQFLLQD